MQWIQNNLGLIIVALSFGLSGLGWLFQKLKQAQEAKQRDRLRQQVRLEELRTGRVENPKTTTAASKPMSARDRIEEAARRRQLEQKTRVEAQKRDLEEQLRRRREAIEAQRQQTAPRPAQPRPPAPPPMQRPGQQQQPQRPAQRQPQRPVQRPPAQAQQRPAGERRRPASIPSTTSTQQTQAAQAAILQSLLDSERERAVAPRTRAPEPVASGLTPATILGADLRQAIILREILDRPIALRQAQDPGW
ncbi:MAG: hypothetical protein KIT54_10190 [Phycisphaeraceae bacterium]|nr:hypothetical protein [Phycisphaeraceae bacterium]